MSDNPNQARVPGAALHMLLLLALSVPLVAFTLDEPASPTTAAQEEPKPQLPPPTEPSTSIDLPPAMAHKQQKELLKLQFEKLKSDADELAELSKSLQAELANSNQHVLSLKVVDQAERIEKLARRIKNEAKGY